MSRKSKTFNILALMVMISMIATTVSAQANTAPTSVDTVEALPAFQSQPDEPETVEAGIQQLTDNVGDAQISIARSTGMVSFVRLTAKQSQKLAAQLGAKATLNAQAAAFFDEYGSIFGIRDASAELALAETKTDNLGTTHLSYVQDYQGVPVFGSVMRVHFDADGLMTAVNGTFVPGIVLNATPTLSADEASAIAETAVNGAAFVTTLGGVSVSLPASTVNVALYVYHDGLIQDIAGINRLVYEVEVSNGADIREFVYVDAHNGLVVNQITGIKTDLHRRVYTETYDSLVWEEGDPYPWTGGSTPTETVGVNNLITVTGQFYNVFSYTFGFDSYDGAGADMIAVYNDAIDLACPNAHWNGEHIGFCEGYDVDDVIAHEWSHAYEVGTHDLIYQYQPGALSESYSDIWGETVDQINGYHTDTPDNPRTADTCSDFTPPGGELLVLPPSPAAGSYAVQAAEFGPTLTVTGTTGLVVLADDGDDTDVPGDPPGSTTDACQPLINGSEIAGNIALIDRGDCNFSIKVYNAQLAGAIGVIIANWMETGLPGMGAGANAELVTIPSIGISLDAGDILKANLPLTATMRSTAGVGDDSIRWLMGEDVNYGAGYGAIRDMWKPSCYGDPDKVTDSVYYACGTGDQGGVHTNSGVPNHAFALLVDGGTYNGHTVGSIGRLKAAHIYWRAQSVYQTPYSNFADHADALETSCADLVTAGTDLLNFDGTASGQVMTTSDCDQITSAIAAVELRSPVICTVAPMFDANPPAPCETATSPFYSETFDADPGTWVVSSTAGYVEWQWVATMPLTVTAPVTRTGGLFALTPSYPGLTYVDGPTMTVPSGGVNDRALVEFEHYVLTEGTADGGNVWISVNGGDWEVLQFDDFVFNGYTGLLGSGTNPLNGQPAFYGSNLGELVGTWGVSQVDVSDYASAGDIIQLRFASATDQGTGVNGWYLDDVSVYYCQAPSPVIGVTPTSLSSTQGTCEQETETLTISNSGQAALEWNVFEGPWVQPNASGNGVVSDYFAGAGAGVYPSDDFTLITDTVITGFYAGGFMNSDPLVTLPAITWYVYPDADGEPAGYPGDGGATEVFSYTAAPTAAGVDAADDTISLNLAQAGQSNLLLPAGTYWLVVYPDTTLAGTWWFWFNGVSTGPENAMLIDPGDLFGAGATSWTPLSALVGWGSLEFTVEGYTAATADCTAPHSTDWLNIDPGSGDIPYGGADEDAEVTFDSTGLLIGDYTATLCLENNDPATPLVQVPVTMTVELAPDWEKTVWVNGDLVTGLDDLIIVEVGDTITVKDEVDVCYAENITFTLTEEWSESLGLVGYETVILPGGSATFPGMMVTEPITDTLLWSVTDLPTDWTYVITKTFTVDVGTLYLGDRDYLTETLMLENAATEQVVLEFGPDEWYIYLPLVIRNS